MPINRSTLLADTKLYLPEYNTLTDAQISSINEAVISDVGDDDEYYSELLCKSLKACAQLNQALSASTGDIKREKSFQREIEFYDSNSDGLWDDYIKSLATICPLLPGGGYKPNFTTNHGFYANVSDPVCFPDLTGVS